MKYKFKNTEIEKALRLVANELGFSDDQLDQSIETWSDTASIRVMHMGITLLSFSTDLLKEVKEFNPYGWNDSDVIPPKDENDPGTSKIMLIENDYNLPYKGYFNFELNCWRELGSCQEIECLRYRNYPTD